MKSLLHHGRFSILLLLLSAITVQLSTGLVHKIPTQIHKLPPEIAKQRWAQKYANNPQMLKILTHSASLEVSSDSPEKKNRTLPLSMDTGVWHTIQVANISVGTPPQQFTVEINWDYCLNMELVDSNATFFGYDIGAMRLFNSSASATYSSVVGAYSDTVTASDGHRGQDIIHLNGQDLNLTFAVLDSVYIYYLRDHAIDGILGLSPADQRTKPKVDSNLTTVMKQIANQLDSPVVSVWTDSSRNGDGIGQITLGALDTDNCESNWMFMPKTEAGYFTSGYTVHLATMEATWTNGTQQTFKANVDLSITPERAGITIPNDWVPLFKNISNAVWDDDVQEYVVDCDTTKLGNVTFRVGGHGAGANSITYNLTITGADYTKYYEFYDVCYLLYHTGVKVNSRSSTPVTLGRNFVRNHCLAYNINDNKIGIADAKIQNRRFMDYE
ncbi:eukaryotic aspartyl protease domain-containing protein [Ditylenchus destructor]|nr:eukaryotic aspartyl protease domain-containing protein [Ditylenchus destructor]